MRRENNKPRDFGEIAAARLMWLDGHDVKRHSRMRRAHGAKYSNWKGERLLFFPGGVEEAVFQ